MNIVNIQIPKAFVLIVISGPNDILFCRVIVQKNTKDIRMRGTCLPIQGKLWKEQIYWMHFSTGLLEIQDNIPSSWELMGLSRQKTA